MKKKTKKKKKTTRLQIVRNIYSSVDWKKKELFAVVEAVEAVEFWIGRRIVKTRPG